MLRFCLNGALLLLLWSCTSDSTPFERSADTLFTLSDPTANGISFSNDLKEDSKLNYLFYESIYNGAGTALADFDNDGLLDIYFAANQEANRLYKNLGDNTFEDITNTAAVGDDSGWSTGVLSTDLNGDGLIDLYVCRFLLEDNEKRRNLLYINQGDMRFEEQAEAFGLADAGYSIHSTALDYDRDGDLDLYVVNQPPNHSARRMALKDSIDYTYTDQLYRNEGNGRFSAVTKEAGLTNYAYGLTAIASDLNGDGWTDIYVACDFDEPDLMYINMGDGTFSEQAKTTLKHMSNFSMGADVADINNDCRPDIFTADMVAEDNKRLKTNMSGMNPKKFQALVDKGFHHQYMFNSLQVNRGNGLYSEVGQLAGVSTTDWSWSALFSDFDNDGYKDLVVTNGLKRDVRDNDFNIARRKRVAELKKEAQDAGKKGISVNPLELLAMSPSTPIANYVYRNNGDLTFTNLREEWGFNQKLTSHGAAYGDIDNDGDIDLVLNNMDAPAALYVNNSEKWTPNHYLDLEFESGHGHNAKITVYGDSNQFYQEMTPVHGYMSSSSPVVHFGLGDTQHIDSIQVEWSDGEAELFSTIKVDSRLMIEKGSGRRIEHAKKENKKPFSAVDLITHQHIENDFNDFATEILIPHRMSRIGPVVCSADVDLNGAEDVFIGGAKGSPSTVWLNLDEGFQEIQLKGSARYEDTGASFVDGDGDGDLDLYVVSGGNEERENMSAYQDRYYVNDGKGNFQLDSSALPKIDVSGSCVLPHDIDGDGDVDLFVGGRQVPGKYPYPARSFILDGHYSEMELSSDLFSGMVTDGLWADLDGDDLKEFVTVGEWSEIVIYKVMDGQIREHERVANSVGWWQSIIAGDFDHDGDLDLAAGNLGLNSKYKTSTAEPFQIFSADFDENGSNDIYLGYYQDGKCFPVRGRECSSQQLPFVKEKFPSYNEFSEATIYEVLGADTAGALNYKADIFESVFLWNNGGKLDMEAMPTSVQFSEVNSIIYQDLDSDGIDDLLLAGNQYDREIETARSDASYGVFLKGTKSGFEEIEPAQSGLYIEGNVRDMVAIKRNKKDLIIVVRNNDQVLSLIEN